MKLHFTKMHGIGNDYIYINAIEQEVSDPSELAIKLSDRRFGIGGDGVILICPSDVADAKMRMFNEDGSVRGGAMYYLADGLKQKWLGILFSILVIPFAFVISGIVDTNTIATKNATTFAIV